MNQNINFISLFPPQAIFSFKVFTSCLLCQGKNVLINQGVPQTWLCLKNACSENMLPEKKISPLYPTSISDRTVEPGRDDCLRLLLLKSIAVSHLFFPLLKNAISPLPFLPDDFIS